MRGKPGRTLENIAAIVIPALIAELEDESKVTYKYLSISKSELSFKHCPGDMKKAMLGKMASNDLVESSFAGVTYRWIGMSGAAAVSNIAQNGFLHPGGNKTQIKHATTSNKKKAME